MTLRVLLGPEASAELSEAARWYGEQHPGLGAEFLSAIDAALDQIHTWPTAAPLVAGLPHDLQVRSVGLRRFPYRIAYLTIDDTVHVVAVAHLRRRPGYWHGRTAAQEPPTDSTF